MRWKIFLVIFLFGISSTCQADTVLFKNGDRMTGKLISIIKEKVSFKSDIAGEVVVNLSDVQNFWTNDNIKINLKDGTILQSRILKSEAGRFTIQGTGILQPQTFDLGDLASVNPPPVPKVKWKGSIMAGFSSTHGNTFNESGSISFNASRKTKKDKTKVEGIYLVSRTRDDDTNEEKTTEESLTIGGKYDYLLTQKIYTYLSCNYKKDHIADLDRRVITGLGAGYQFINTDNVNFLTDVGLALLSEKYTTKNPVTNEKEVDTTDEFSLQLGYIFDYNLSDKIIFMHKLSYLPSLEESFSDYFMHTDAEIRFLLTKSMFSSFKAILDYDSTPAEGIGSTDSKYIFSLGWNF